MAAQIKTGICDGAAKQCTLLDVAAHAKDDVVAEAEREARAEPGDATELKLRSAYVAKTWTMLEAIGVAEPFLDEVDSVAVAATEDLNAAAAASSQYTAKVQDRRARKAELNKVEDRAGVLNAQSGAAGQRADAADREFYAAKREASQFQDVGQMGYEAGQGAAYLQWMQRRDHIVAGLETDKVKYQMYNAAVATTTTSMEDSDLKEKLAEVDSWLDLHTEQLRDQIDKLETAQQGIVRSWKDAQTLGWIGDEVSAHDHLEAVEKIAKRWQARLKTESDRRKGEQEALQERFMQDDIKLLQWCRLERTNLEALREPGHQQEFIASLLKNISTMEENFKHLCDLGTSLLPCRDVERALVEVSEVWLFLMMVAFELHQQLMYEIHPTAKLEDQVRVFAGWTDTLNDVLADVQQQCRVDESDKAVQIDRRAGDLKRDLGQYLSAGDAAGMPANLRAFSERMDKIRGNYQALRRHVLGKLTFISDTETVPEDRAAARQRDYDERTKEIEKWAESSELNTWKYQHTQFKDLKGLIEGYLVEARKASSPVTSARAASNPTARSLQQMGAVSAILPVSHADLSQGPSTNRAQEEPEPDVADY